MDMTNERICSPIFDLRAMFLSFQMVLSIARAAVVWADLASTSGMDPSSMTIAPKCLKLSTQSSLTELIWMSVLMPLVYVASRQFVCFLH